MSKEAFPKITTVVKAEPLEKNHVARITSYRITSKLSRRSKNIEAKLLLQ